MLASLVGQKFDFHGVDNHRFKLDMTIYEALEDENDGYRSSLGEVIVYEDPLLTFLKHNEDIFFQLPLATVEVRIAPVNDPAVEGEYNYGYDFAGHDLVDTSDGHIWLRVGTDNVGDVGDWYPCFTFSYHPREVA